MDSPDISCLMSMATDFESCSAAIDANGVSCVWCSLGGDLGGCVGSDIVGIINSAEIPHFQCGVKTLSDEDEVFFNDLMSCFSQGDTADACHGSSVPCTWCVTFNAPFFATCFSDAFVTVAQEVQASTDMLSSVVMDCSPQAPTDVGAIMDVNCGMNAYPSDEFPDADALASVCTFFMDAQGNLCVVASFFGMLEICTTETGKAILDYLVDYMDMMGIANPMSVFGGESGSVGGGGAFVEDDDAEFFGDEPAWSTEVDDSYGEETPWVPDSYEEETPWVPEELDVEE